MKDLREKKHERLNDMADIAKIPNIYLIGAPEREN